MNYAKIRDNDIANGEGVRVSLFVSGCNFHCKGCFNPEVQDFDYGEPLKPGDYDRVIEMVRKPTIDGLSILGGDPLCQPRSDIMVLIYLCSQIRNKLEKTVWLWTGYTWEDIFGQDISSETTPDEQLRDAQRQLVCSCDVVVDGQFVESLADRKLVWRGSSNQRVIDVQASLKAGEIVLWKVGGDNT